MMMKRKRSTGRDAAIMIGGIVAGIAVSRIIPPLVAMIRGAARARAGEDPFALLIEDHRQILATLDQMAAAPADAKAHRVRLFLKLKRKLAKHALAEEDVVYPEFHSDQQHADESKHMYDEHADMKILLFELENLVMSGSPWTEQVRSLRELVRRHADEEEQRIFPSLRRALTENRRPKVSGQIRREEALIL